MFQNNMTVLLWKTKEEILRLFFVHLQWKSMGMVGNMFLLCHTGLKQHEKLDDSIFIWVNYPFKIRHKSFILSLLL